MSRNFELLQKTEKERELRREHESQRHLTLHDAQRGSTATADIGHGAGPMLAMDETSETEVIKLIQRLFLSAGARRSVVFASVASGDGCSWITARAATMLASHVSGTVCVVDANFRSPALHDYFAVGNNHGLKDALVEAHSVKDFAQRLPKENLWIMTSGSSVPADARLMTSSTFRTRVAELYREFDYVLFDTSPLGLYPDAITLAHIAEGVALVVGANSTRREMARRVVQDLENATVSLRGVVLNKRTVAIPDRLSHRLRHFLP